MKSMMIAALLLLEFGALNAQQVGPPKTIYERLHLTPGGCPLSYAVDQQPIDYSSVLPYSDEGIIKPLFTLDSIIRQCQPLIKKHSRFLDTVKISLGNGNYFFRVNELYGLKSAAGKVIIKPTFWQVTPDGKNGFVAYSGAVCNYYNNDGKALLSSSFYAIKPTSQGTFIVNTSTGYGVVDAATKMIIPPTYYDISTTEKKGNFYYRLFNNSEVCFYLSRDTKDTILFNTGYFEPEILSDEYWYDRSTLINVKTKQKLICEAGYQLELVSADQQILSLRVMDTTFFFNFKGELLDDGTVGYARNFNTNGVAVAIANQGRGIDNGGLAGLVNTSGKWILKPFPGSLSNIAEDLYVMSTTPNSSAIIDKNGNILTGQKYERIYKINDELICAFVKIAGKMSLDIFSISQRRIIKDNLPYEFVISIDICGKQQLIAGTRQGRILLNSDFQPGNNKIYSDIGVFESKKLIRTEAKTVAGKKVISFYSCNNLEKPVPVKIAGKYYTEISNKHSLGEGFIVYELTDGKKYLQLPDKSFIPYNEELGSISSVGNGDLYKASVDYQHVGIIDRKGNFIVPPVFFYIGKFDPVSKTAKYHFDDVHKGLITSEGTLLFGTQYEDVTAFTTNIFLVKDHEKYGVVDRNNKIIIPVQYKKISLKDGIIKADNGKKYDLDGNAI